MLMIMPSCDCVPQHHIPDSRHVLKHAQHDVGHVVQLLAGPQHAQTVLAQQRLLALVAWGTRGGGMEAELMAELVAVAAAAHFADSVRP